MQEIVSATQPDSKGDFERPDWGWFVEEEDMISSDEEFMGTIEEEDQERTIFKGNGDLSRGNFGSHLDVEYEEKEETNSSCSIVSADEDVHVLQEETYDFQLFQPEVNEKIDENCLSKIPMLEEKEMEIETDQKLLMVYEKNREKRGANVELFRLAMNIVPFYNIVKSKSIEGLNALAKHLGSISSKISPQYALYPLVLTIVNVILIDRRNECTLLTRAGS